MTADLVAIPINVNTVLLVLLLATTGLGVVKAYYEARAARRAVEQVHRIVNSQHDALIGWAKVMANRLAAAGVDVPPPPSDVDLRSGELGDGRGFRNDDRGATREQEGGS